MERVKIALPETFSFSCKIKIRITDLNYGGHVGNERFLSIAHEARVQYLSVCGYTETDVEGKSLIMNDAAIEFTSELLYGYEVEVFVKAVNFHKYGFDIFYKIEFKKGEEIITAAKIKTGLLYFDYANRKLSKMDDHTIKTIQNKFL